MEGHRGGGEWRCDETVNDCASTIDAYILHGMDGLDLGLRRLGLPGQGRYQVAVGVFVFHFFWHILCRLSGFLYFRNDTMYNTSLSFFRR